VNRGTERARVAIGFDPGVIVARPDPDTRDLRLEFNDLAPSEVRAVARVLDGWRLEITYVRSEDGPVPQAITLRPELPGTPIGSKRVLRRLGFGPVVDAVDKMIRDPWLSRYLGPAWARPTIRPGRRGTDDAFYLDWALKYVDAYERDPRRPIQVLLADAEAAGEYRTEKELRSFVNRARARALLTRAPKNGLAGGELTAKASRLKAERDRLDAAFRRENPSWHL
jgi:hypothetical protein